MAIRLILGCLRAVAGRLGMGVHPLFVESDMHYYRTYVRVANRSDQEENLGFIVHCYNCRHREISRHAEEKCRLCDSEIKAAGPLWIGRLFEKEFVQDMLLAVPELTVDKSCEKIVANALLESEMPGTYYTSDEIAAKTKSSPPKLNDIIAGLQRNGFMASPTAFNPTGFRTDAGISDIEKMFIHPA